MAACVLARERSDESSHAELVETISDVKPYESGCFYLRELPCLMALLSKIPEPDVIVVDCYVWLAPKRPGLGAHLYDESNQIISDKNGDFPARIRATGPPRPRGLRKNRAG